MVPVAINQPGRRRAPEPPAELHVSHASALHHRAKCCTDSLACCQKVRPLFYCQASWMPLKPPSSAWMLSDESCSL